VALTSDYSMFLVYVDILVRT